MSPAEWAIPFWLKQLPEFDMLLHVDYMGKQDVVRANRGFSKVVPYARFWMEKVFH